MYKVLCIAHLTAGDSTPSDRCSSENVAQEARQWEQDGDTRQGNDGQEAVAQDRDDAGEGHPGDRHQVEEEVHGHAAQQPDTVDVVEI